MILLLQSEITTLFSFTNVVIGLFGFLVIIGAALIVLLSKRKDNLADTNEKLLKARDTEVSDCEKKCNKCTEELEDVTAEYRALAAIDLKDLFHYWQIREIELARIQTLESENRVLRLRLHDVDPKND